MAETAAHLLGALAIILGFVGYQCKRRKTITWMQAAIDTCFGVQYFLLGAYTGTFMDVIGVIRNVTMASLSEDKKKRTIFTGVFVALLVASCLFTWAGPVSLLAMAGKTCSTVSFGVTNPKILRLLTVPSCVLWIIYDILCGSYTGIVYESIKLCSVLIALVRYDRRRKEQIPPAGQEETVKETV